MLLVIALLGIGFGVWMMSLAFGAPGQIRGAALASALAVGAVPFIAGTVALAGVGAMFGLEQVRGELVMSRERAELDRQLATRAASVAGARPVVDQVHSVARAPGRAPTDPGA
ncbi:MAG: hypothetical protein KF773_34815 [Deltaproteobacteria bacterium]|nr:hypothetical protein [Deltaproteobacteria bacterium]